MTHPAPPTVHVAADALAVIIAEARQSYDGLETGGILLGHDSQDRIDIRHAGAPGPLALRGPRTFNRDLGYAKQLAQQAWSEDKSQWIGEWHTHPLAGSAPSDVDLNSYLSHLHNPELRLSRFVAIIVSINEPDGMIAVTWLIEPHGYQPISLRTTDD